MADEYVSEVILEINGKKITDFRSVSEDPIVLAKAVQLMGKTGRASVTPRYGVSVEYVVPANKPKFDFTAVKDGTLTIIEPSGGRTIYTGVFTVEIGSRKYDGENPAAPEIKFAATGRREE